MKPSTAIDHETGPSNRPAGVVNLDDDDDEFEKYCDDRSNCKILAEIRCGLTTANIGIKADAILSHMHV